MVRFLGRNWRIMLTVFVGFVLAGPAIPTLAPAPAHATTLGAAQSGALAGTGAAATGTTAAQPWSKPEPLPKGAALATSDPVTPTAIDCAGTGDCAAVGTASPANSPYLDDEPFVDNQVNGKWQPPQKITGLPKEPSSYGDSVDAVSCSSPGNCTAGGLFSYDGDVNHIASQPFLTTETNGKWAPAQQVPGIATLNTDEAGEITSVSCSAVGYCTAGGTYGTPIGNGIPETIIRPFTVDEIAGKWQRARPIPGVNPATGGSSVWPVIVTCAAPGDCTVGGAVSVATDSAFTLSDTAFKWNAVKPIKGMHDLDGLDCPATGDCVAVGGNQVAQSSGGTWGSAKAVGGTDLTLSQVSCSSRGNCLAGGFEWPGAGPEELQPTKAAVVSQEQGNWAVPQTLSSIVSKTAGGNSSIGTISCAGSGQCEIGGSYSVGTDLSNPSNGFAAPVNQGKPLAPQTFAAGGVGLISCTALASCGSLMAGSVDANGVSNYADFSQKLPVTTAAAISLSTAKITYGHETAERISVSVHPEADDPKGKVVVKAGKATVCVITLSSAKGSCKLTAKQLKPGNYAMTATYSGAPGFRSAVSGASKLTVLPHPL
jgi:hypothetical protein